MTREETKRRFKTWCQWHIGNNASDEDYHMFNNIMALLEQEPRKGYWKTVPYEQTLYCSECNLRLDDEQTYILLNYCPKCGARMEKRGIT